MAEKDKNKPLIPKTPGDEANQKKAEGPNPNSDPNYQYFPNVAYPTNSQEDEEE